MEGTNKTDLELYNEAKAMLDTAEEAKGVEMLQKLAEQGLLEAQTDLGIMYAYGQHVAQNDELSVKWYEKGAMQKGIVAIAGLGEAYLLGLGGKDRDWDKAEELLLEAGHNGSSFAQSLLGDMYRGCVNINNTVYSEQEKYDFVESIVWYTRAAQLGNQYANDMIAKICG